MALHATLAAAAPRDAAASKLNREAIETDYLGMQFNVAERKLKQGISLCGVSACSPAILAQLHRDLGVVYLAANRGNEVARAEFAAALSIDPATALPRDLATPEAAQLFAEVKAAAGPPGAASGAEELTHTPPTEVKTSTPLPLYVELAQGFDVAKVQVHYRNGTSAEWKSLDLKKLATGYGIEVPCADVGATAGELRYFIQAVNAADEPVATHGTRNAPHMVPIVAELTAPPPHLPGRAPPEACGAASCTPGAPGCPVSEPPRAAGAACSEDAACASLTCRQGICAAEAAPLGKSCQSDTDCDAGQACGAGVCAGAGKKNWLSLAIQQDGLFLPSASGACSGDTTYTCFDGPNLYIPRTLQSGSDNAPGGFSLATARILLGYDRVVHDNVTVGVRVGFAFNNGPTEEGGTKFLPLHAELRAAYWFGLQPTVRVGLRPYVLLSGGLAQVDGKRRLTVLDPGDGHQAAPEYHLQAWRRAGRGFGAAGAGLMYAFSSSTGVVAEMKLLQMFGTASTGLAAQIGFVQGL